MTEAARRELSHLPPVEGRLSAAFGRPKLIAAACVVVLAGLGWFYLGLLVAGGAGGPFQVLCSAMQHTGSATELGLIDEYRLRVYPVLVGGGIPFFPQARRRVDLELVETRAFDSGVVYLRHRVRR